MIWSGLGGNSLSLLCMVSAGVAYLDWKSSASFTHTSEAPAGMAGMARDGQTKFSPHGFSVQQGRGTPLHGVSGLLRE